MFLICDDCKGEYAPPTSIAGLCPNCADAKDSYVGALELLDQDFSEHPRWPSKKLNDTIGPLIPGITIVAARPGGGKTTLMKNTVRSLVWDQGVSCVFAGMETTPAAFRLQLAALELRYPWDQVYLNSWHTLPTGARGHLLKALREQKEIIGPRLTITPEPRLKVRDALQWIEWADQSNVPVVIIDHLHEMDWGNSDNLTRDMDRGLRVIREHVAQSGKVRLLAAAQLRRPGGHDPLEEYMVPPPSAIKQSGTSEEVARMVLMLHRSLQEEATEGDLNLVRKGQQPVSSVVEEGTMSIHIAKARERGSLKGQEVRLYVGDDRLYDTPAQRNADTHWTPVLGPREEG